MIDFDLVRITLRFITNDELLQDGTRQGVQIRLLNVLAVANIKAAIGPLLFKILVVYLQLLSTDLNVAILIVSKVLTVGVEGVDGHVVILAVVHLNSTSVLVILDQLNVSDALEALV